MPKPPSTPELQQHQRSPCPVACFLDILGDRWTLLVVRDLMLGKSRFKEFMASPERIPTNILSERLTRLLRHGIAVQTSTAGSKHLAYQLTEKGRALHPMLAGMRDWGLKWEQGTLVPDSVADTAATRKEPRG